MIIILNNFNVPTDTKLETCINGSDDDVAGIIIKTLINILLENGTIKEQDRARLTDEEYIAYIQENKPAILIGSEYSFEAESYKNRVMLNEYLQECDYIFAGDSEGLLILKQRPTIYIKDIKVRIRSGKIEDEKTVYNPTTESYKYEIMAGMPAEFTKTELDEFLHNQRKVVELSVKIGIKAPQELLGAVLWRKNC